jgi:LacI family transcriptional regulator
MSVSLKNIADELGLSKATVSWILSGQGERKGFSSATIKRVKAYADSVNYQPNLLARSLSLGKTQTIGLIIPYIDDTFYAKMVQYLEKELSQQGYSLIVCTSEGNSEKEENLVKMICSKKVDGIVMAATMENKSAIDYIEDRKIPLVLIDRYDDSWSTSYVAVNNKKAVRKLIEKMHLKGAQRIAFITTDTQLHVMEQRKEGYQEALKEANLAFDSDLLLQVNRTHYKSDLKDQLKHLFEQQIKIDGFCFATHYLAIEAMRFFTEQGISINNNYILGCFHETEMMDILLPDLIISRMPVSDMVQRAASLLMNKINNATTPFESYLLENELTF